MSIDAELQSVLSENPWTEMAGALRNALRENKLNDNRFVLTQDDCLIHKAEGLNVDPDSKLMLGLPPQPFIGHPKSKIWILQYNPGYSPGFDEFDYNGTLSGCIEKKRCRNCSCIRDRIELVCNQYEFKEGVGFYGLDERFHTFTSGTRRGCGTYLWYKKTFFPEKGAFSRIQNLGITEKAFADENLFVIEYMPYHSRKFQCEFFPFLPSFEFWKKLMQYAFTHEKIVLCHGRIGTSSLQSRVLESISGYKDAAANGYLYHILRRGKGRCKMSLNKKLVNCFGKDCNRLDSHLRALRH